MGIISLHWIRGLGVGLALCVQLEVMNPFCFLLFGGLVRGKYVVAGDIYKLFGNFLRWS